MNGGEYIDWDDAGPDYGMPCNGRCDDLADTVAKLKSYFRELYSLRGEDAETARICRLALGGEYPTDVD